MQKRNLMGIVLAMLMMSVIPGNVFAGDFVTKLHKTYVQFGPPYEEVRVGMEVILRFEHQEGGRKDAERNNAMEWNDLLVNELCNRGWREDRRAVDDVQAEPMELIVNSRVRIYSYECNPKRDDPYHSGNEQAYLSQPIEGMENCLIENKGLKEEKGGGKREKRREERRDDRSFDRRDEGRDDRRDDRGSNREMERRW